MTGLGIFIDQFGSRFLSSLLPDTRVGGMPAITNPMVNQVDLHLGLALVALVEEMIFRGLYFTVLGQYLSRTVWVFALSSLSFGLIHWSLGLAAIIHTGLIGAIFMVCMWRTKSVLPTIIAHFCVNYAAFSGVFGMT